MSGEANRPWIDGDLVIDAAVMDEMEAHARSTFPSECCGLVSGPAGTPALLDAYQPIENEADKYHALDPETFPSTSEMYFKINELKAGRAFEAGEAEGRPIKVIYHSHCNAGAYFSEEDAATFANEGQLMWPCAFIVVSVIDGEVKDRKLHVHVAGTNTFRESELRLR
jgi:proteasome lid subunit RPN8/RPN11